MKKPPEFWTNTPLGNPGRFNDSPATPFVYGFLGSVNVVPALVKDGQIRLEGFETTLGPADSCNFEGPADLYVRAHDFELSDDRLHAIPGIVRMVRHFSGLTRMGVGVPGRKGVITVEIPEGRFPGKPWLEEGSRILLRPRRFGVFPQTTDRVGRSSRRADVLPQLKVVS